MKTIYRILISAVFVLPLLFVSCNEDLMETNKGETALKLKANTTDFDGEAFVVLQDSIYIFAKQWTTQKSSVYSLPKIPGTYVAQLKETLSVKGLITGATLLPKNKGIVLCGYSKMLKPFVYLLYDYKNNVFSSGNKRKIKLKLCEIIFAKIFILIGTDYQMYFRIFSQITIKGKSRFQNSIIDIFIQSII